ncbi:hypothetical protein B0H19DRAFT_1074547 [Mycena capillaripes]|nr:hypothetical protein B0H19DRAFT_1074547 [Mycena capillaripes]
MTSFRRQAKFCVACGKTHRRDRWSNSFSCKDPSQQDHLASARTTPERTSSPVNQPGIDSTDSKAAQDMANLRGGLNFEQAATDVFTNVLAQMRAIEWATSDELAVAQAIWATMAVTVFGAIYSRVHRIGWTAADEGAHARLNDMVGIEQPEWLASATDSVHS